jgi:hypothetical protein
MLGDPLTGDGLGGNALGSPFDGGALGAPAALPTNPYAAPAAAAPQAKKTRAGKKRGGAEITTIVCGIFLAIYAGGQLIVTVVVMLLRGVQSAMLPPAMMENMSEQQRAMLVGMQIGQIVGLVIGIAIMLLMLAGGVQMARLKMWGLALTASILALMPCNCPFCFVGIPLGIWGITMLCLPAVRKAF